MSVFSTNQARHLFVATAKAEVTEAAAAGTIEVKGDTAKNHLYFKYMGKGGQIRSDLIDIKNILYAKAVDAKAYARELKAVEVTLNEAPIPGQDYILKIAFRQFAGMSDEDVYTKFGMVHATNDMADSASTFYVALAESLVKNFSRELTKLVKFALATDSDAVEVTTATKFKELNGTYTGLIITEVEQEWTLGIKPQVPVYFDVLPGTVISSGDEVIWGSVEKLGPEEDDTDKEGVSYVQNGKNIADLEYFCMGERGDQYRGIGWPNAIVTEYMVDPTQRYHTLDIHYAYVGANESVQKSEKDLTIVCADKEVLNGIIDDINTATGLTIASLTDSETDSETNDE